MFLIFNYLIIIIYIDLHIFSIAR